MKNIILWGLIATLLVVGFVLSYGNNRTEARVGVIAPLTGIFAFYGEDVQRGVLASGISASSTVFEDEKCESVAAVSAFTKLVNIDKAAIIIGPACGSPQEAVVPLLREADAVVLVPSSASSKLFAQSGGKFFNVQYSLENDGAFLARTLAGKRVVLVSYQNAFSETIAESFKANFDGQVVSELSFRDDKTDIATELIKLRGLEYDAVVVTDVTFFFAGGMEKLERFDIQAPVYAQYTIELPAARPLAEGVYYSFPADVEGTQGATFELSKKAGEIANQTLMACGDDSECAIAYLRNSGLFDETGVYKREIVLKQIKNGMPIKVESL